MKYVIPTLALILFCNNASFAQAELELKPDQSMSIAGKGPGQDAAINPFLGQDCYAIVENTGKSEFSIRVQQDGKIIETIPIAKGEMKKVSLLVGYELYFDAESYGMAKAKVDFEKMEE